MITEMQRRMGGWIVELVAPALIMLMTGSLAFFLVEVFYYGASHGRVKWVLTLFVFASVLTSRISIMEGFARATFYGMVLGAATLLVLNVLTEVSFTLSVVFIGVIWWFNSKLTWDCTVIDQTKDSTDRGLLSRFGFDSDKLDSQKEYESEETVEDENAALGTTDDDTKGKTVSWTQRLMSRKNAPNTPGVWVLILSLAAFPIFGIGQGFISDEVRRQNAFFDFCLYLIGGLGLLVTTAMIGLQRYLQKRNATMPNTVAITWVVSGVIMIGAILVSAWMLPRPYSEYSFAENPFKLTKQSKWQSSRYAVGSEGKDDGKDGNQDNSAKNNKSGSGKSKDQGGSKSGSRKQGNSQNSKSGKGQSGKGKSASNKSGQGNSKNNQSRNPSNDNSKSGNRKAGNRKTSGKGRDSNSKSDQSNQGTSKNQPASQKGKQNSKESSSNKQSGDKNRSGDPSKKNRKSDSSQSSQSKNDQPKSSDSQNRNSQKSGENRSQGPEKQGSENRAGQSGRDKSSPKQDETKANQRRDSSNNSGRSSQGSSSQNKSQNKSQKNSSSSSSSSSEQKSSFKMPTMGNIAWIVQLIFWIALGIVLVILAIKYRQQLWESLLKFIDDLKNFWANLFGRKKRQAKDEITNSVASRRRPTPRAFATYSDPYASGKASSMSISDLVLYSFEALEAWARERGCSRSEDQTPHEFALDLVDIDKSTARQAKKLADFYCTIAFAEEQLDEKSVRTEVSELWRLMQQSVPADSMLQPA